MVEKAISSLLKFNSRVVIPEFGAVIKNLDFSQTAFFNQFIKFDDRLLMSYLMDTVGFSKDKAEAEIFAFITRVSKEIERGNNYHVEGVGYFCLLEGRIELYSSPEDIPFSQPATHAPSLREELPASVGEPEIQEEQVEQQAIEANDREEYREEASAEAIPVSYPADEFFREEEEDLYEEHERTENTPKRKEAWIGAGVAIGILAIIAVVVIYRTNIFADGSDDTAIGQEAGSSVQEAGIAPAAYVTDIVPEGPDNDPEKSEGGPEPAMAKETVQQARAEEGKAILSTGYHVIIGAFKNEMYADRLVKNCRRSGIEARKLDKLNNDFFLVSYAEFESLERAREEHQKIAQRYEGAWLVGDR